VTNFPKSDFSQFNQLRFEPFHQLDGQGMVSVPLYHQCICGHSKRI
jgi:hypothetical protein